MIDVVGGTGVDAGTGEDGSAAYDDFEELGMELVMDPAQQLHFGPSPDAAAPVPEALGQFSDGMQGMQGDGGMDEDDL